MPFHERFASDSALPPRYLNPVVIAIAFSFVCTLCVCSKHGATGSRNPRLRHQVIFRCRILRRLNLNIYRADPSTDHGMDVRDLPLAILPYLLPSRFAPSDKLAQFATRSLW